MKAIKLTFWTLLALFLTMSASSCEGLGGFKKGLYYQKASKAHNQGRFQKAIENYNKALEEDPKDAMIQYELGVAYLDAGNKKKAKMQVSKLNKIDQDLAKALDNLVGQI